MKMFLQYLLPHHLLTKFAGWCGNHQTTWFKNYLIRYFLGRFNVDMHIAEQSDPFSYPSFNAFFTRRLKPDARPIDADPKSIVSPADARIFQFGDITENTLVEAKQASLTVDALVGDANLAKPFINGQFMTLYLSPVDYHRVHMPVTGTLVESRYIPGQLFSVQPEVCTEIPNLFARNERLVCHFETENGPCVVIMVGAMLVASIHTTWAGQITPTPSRTIQTWNHRDESITLKRGEELGYFQLGSTVILLFPSGKAQWSEHCTPEKQVVVGEKIAVQ